MARKRKAGAKRTAKGRISRARDATFDRGSDYTALKFSVYGPDGSDAIGRAHHHELLGPDGLTLRNTARNLHRAYWPMLHVGREKSCLGLDVFGHQADDSTIDWEERQRRIDRERKLTDTLRRIDRMGAQHRRAFDQLVIEINPDSGPKWLDALIWSKSHKREPDIAAAQALAHAIAVLEAVSNEW